MYSGVSRDVARDDLTCRALGHVTYNLVNRGQTGSTRIQNTSSEFTSSQEHHRHKHCAGKSDNQWRLEQLADRNSDDDLAFRKTEYVLLRHIMLATFLLELY